MILEIKNIGKFKYARIEINGITVIAGPNNTGKSTLGKVLYCLFNAFYDINNKALKEQIDFCNKILNSLVINNIDSRDVFTTYLPNEELKINNLNIDEVNLKNKIQKYFNKNFKKDIKDTEIDFVIENINKIRKAPIEKYAETILFRIINKEFYNQFLNVNEENAEIKLNLAKKVYKFSLNVNAIKISDVFIGSTDVIYIDDPYIVDNVYDIDENELRYNLFKNVFNANTHQKNLENRFYDANKHQINVYEEIDRKNILNDVFEKIANTVKGEFTKLNKREAFKERNIAEPIYLPNLSTGLKTFLILKRLIESSSIKEKDILILDEPEIHLHPEWQLVLAEIIVLLQKRLNLHILINTHSPYFLNAIEVYSQLHNIRNNMKYYLSYLEEKDGIANIKDVTSNLEEIYYLLATPLQKLNKITFKFNNFKDKEC